LAIDYIENSSKERIEQAMGIIDNVCEMPNISKSDLAIIVQNSLNIDCIIAVYKFFPSKKFSKNAIQLLKKFKI
jgi:hypothetical protein